MISDSLIHCINNDHQSKFGIPIYIAMTTSWTISTFSNILFCMLYNHDNVNNNSNNTNIGGTNEFIPFYLQSLATRGERHKSWKHMVTILCCPPPPLRTTHLVVFKISIHLCRSRPKNMIWSDPKNSSERFNSKTQLTRLFQIFKFSGPSLPSVTSTTLSIHSNCHPAPFPFRRFIMRNTDCHILSARV